MRESKGTRQEGLLRQRVAASSRKRHALLSWICLYPTIFHLHACRNESIRNETIDSRRLVAFALVGGLLSGYGQLKWFIALHSIVPKHARAPILTRLALDQARARHRTSSPLCICLVRVCTRTQLALEAAPAAHCSAFPSSAPLRRASSSPTT